MSWQIVKITFMPEIFGHYLPFFLMAFIFSALVHRQIILIVSMFLLLLWIIDLGYFSWSFSRGLSVMGNPKAELPPLDIWQDLIEQPLRMVMQPDALPFTIPLVVLYAACLWISRTAIGRSIQESYSIFDEAIEIVMTSPFRWMKPAWASFRKMGEKKREQNRLLKDSGYRKGTMPVQLPQADGTMQTVFIKIPGGGGGWFAKARMIMGIATFCSLLSGGYWAYSSAEIIMSQLQSYATATANQMARDAAEEAGRTINKYLPPFLRR